MTYERTKATPAWTTDGRKVVVDSNPSTDEVIVYAADRKVLRLNRDEGKQLGQNLVEASGAQLDVVPPKAISVPSVTESTDTSSGVDSVLLELPEYRQRRSVSQVEQYANCGEQYRLQRVEQHGEVPAWWNIGGKAVHATCEEYERQDRSWFGTVVKLGDATKHFYRTMAILTTEEAASTSVPMDEWRCASAKRNPENAEWWYQHGPEMVEMFVELHAPGTRQVGHGRKLEMLSPGEVHDVSVPLVEWEFLLDVEGVNVKGYVDRIEMDNGRLRPVDIKAGKNKPQGGGFQLAVYTEAVERFLGACSGADYYMARTGEWVSYERDQLMSWDAIVARVHAMDKAEKEDIYVADVSMHCSWCSVNQFCVFYNPGLML